MNYWNQVALLSLGFFTITINAITQPMPSAPAPTLDEVTKAAVAKTKLLSENLLDFAREGSKTLENIPRLIAVTKEFFNQSMSLIATIKNDMEHIKENIKTVYKATDDHEKVKQLASLTEANQLLLNNMTQLNLLCAQVIYTVSDAIIEPFHGEMASRGMSTALLIREITKDISSLTKELHNLSNRYNK